MSLATAFKKMHPLQRRQIANILGWIAALLMFAHFYINTSRAGILLYSLTACIIWLFAVYLAGIGGRTFKKKGMLLRRINNEQRAFIADSGTALGMLLIVNASILEYKWWHILLLFVLVMIIFAFCIALVGIKDK